MPQSNVAMLDVPNSFLMSACMAAGSSRWQQCCTPAKPFCSAEASNSCHGSSPQGRQTVPLFQGRHARCWARGCAGRGQDKHCICQCAGCCSRCCHCCGGCTPRKGGAEQAGCAAGLALFQAGSCRAGAGAGQAAGRAAEPARGAAEAGWRHFRRQQPGCFASVKGGTAAVSILSAVHASGCTTGGYGRATCVI